MADLHIVKDGETAEPQALVDVLPQVLAELQTLNEGVGEILSFIDSLKDGAREAVQMGGMQGMMAKNLIPPSLLS